MVRDNPLEATQYRLVIARRGANEILISTDAPEWSLPSLEIMRGERLAEQIARSIQKRYAFRIYCLWLNRSFATHGVSCPYAVVATVADHDDAPPGMAWIGLCEAFSHLPLRRSHQALLRQMTHELERHVANSGANPFGRPGWIDDLLAWVEREIAPSRLTGNFDQLQAGPTFNLIRIETTRAAVWFKATGQPIAHERAVTLALARLLPDFLPRVIAHHPTWNGWLAEEASGRRLDHSIARDWVAAARGLAEMQIASRGLTDAVLKSGAKKLALLDLGNDIGPFFERIEELMALQPSEPPQILSRTQIGELANSLTAACEELEHYRWPDTLGHLDLNPGNVFVASERCCFLDWAEAYVGHPLFTFEYLSEHARRSIGQADAAMEAAYLEPWRSHVSSEVLVRSLAVSPLLAVFAYAVGDRRWRSADLRRSPWVARHFRSLARRAYREAIRLHTRSNPCPT